jgi:16S rRNA C967 or C1407 C5-methylase (RsmB/RsmF family)
LKILDLAAAPGGKSTHAQSLISDESVLVSNEVIKTRVNVCGNLIKWGGKNVVVTNNDAKDFARLENYFDVIVVDAPAVAVACFEKIQTPFWNGARETWNSAASAKSGSWLMYILLKKWDSHLFNLFLFHGGRRRNS